ncbi:MAG: hypothetical protein KIY11_00595 [Thermoplasmata archaeon]|nr:hypothetical protein [Candidatus Sysuiplasma acidicola]
MTDSALGGEMETHFMLRHGITRSRHGTAEEDKGFDTAGAEGENAKSEYRDLPKNFHAVISANSPK